jgi:LysW-gamma-L-lysine/LysW-L-ornithine aminotransferase
MNLFEKESTYTSGLYTKHPIMFVKGSGASLWDVNNKEYIDCIGGHGVANFGHSNHQIADAITEQAKELLTLPETFYNDKRAMLMERLCNLVPGLNRVFFCNSGTESVEAAFKFARLSTGHTEIIACMRGFHGRTFGALSATWNKKYRQPFEPLVPEFIHVPYNDKSALKEAISGNTAAFILEVIQGEGGVYLADSEYLYAAQSFCHENDTLLIIDEVQTGFGRTGKLFAIQHTGITPDILCLAKSIAGGLPMGAILFGQKVQNLSPGLHGSTFGGNPLVCSAALTVLDILENTDIIHKASEKGEYFQSQLRKIKSPLIREIRGLGLMIGIELKQKVAPYLQQLELNGVLALPAGLSVIRLLPPLVITYSQINQVVDTIGTVLSNER